MSVEEAFLYNVENTDYGSELFLFLQMKPDPSLSDLRRRFPYLDRLVDHDWFIEEFPVVHEFYYAALSQHNHHIALYPYDSLNAFTLLIYPDIDTFGLQISNLDHPIPPRLWEHVLTLPYDCRPSSYAELLAISELTNQPPPFPPHDLPSFVIRSSNPVPPATGFYNVYLDDHGDKDSARNSDTEFAEEYYDGEGYWVDLNEKGKD
jgi:hypothetical protein